MQSAPLFLPEARRRLDNFYSQLAHWGEVAPAVRSQLEGFLEAGVYMRLVSREQLRDMIVTSYGTFMGEAPAPIPGSADSVQLPVLWARAPVYAPGKGGPK
jgi:hypothetical protein